MIGVLARIVAAAVAIGTTIVVPLQQIVDLVRLIALYRLCVCSRRDSAEVGVHAVVRSV